MAPSRGPPKPKKHLEKITGQKKRVLNQKQEEPGEYGGASRVPIDLQQKLINVFRDTFKDTINSDITKTLQEIKSHLYNRDFSQAFGRKNYLEAYALRWSPSRALCYAEIFLDVLAQCQQKTQSDSLEIACLGGGAGAEVVGLAGTLRWMVDAPTPIANSSKGGRALSDLRLHVHTSDIADWSSTIAALQTALTTTPPISAYASAAAKATNFPLLQNAAFDTCFDQADLLKLDKGRLKELVGNADLVTLMFTLNELYSASLSDTQTFLDILTGVIQVGALLLVVDSPGSYSAVSLNGKEKRYPMHWLLDYTLVKEQQSPGDDNTGHPQWEKLRTEESTWFRLPESLKYPIQLEDMRYQLHLYRRT